MMENDDGACCLRWDVEVPTEMSPVRTDTNEYIVTPTLQLIVEVPVPFENTFEQVNLKQQKLIMASIELGVTQTLKGCHTIFFAYVVVKFKNVLC